MTEATLTATRTADAEESVPRSAGALAHIVTIAKRERVSYFESPIAYVFIVIFLLLVGFFTIMVSGFFERGEANLEPFSAWHLWLYLFLVPAIGMRMWSEERRSGAMALLLTMPITPWQAIVGKFIAAWLVLALARTFPIVITVNYLGHPDNGVIVAGYIGSLLLAGAYLSISAMTSALTRNQVVSFYPFRNDLPLSRPRRVFTGDESARAMGQSLGGAGGLGLRRGDAFRGYSQGRDRFARHPFLPLGHRVLVFYHERSDPKADSGIRTNQKPGILFPRCRA